MNSCFITSRPGPIICYMCVNTLYMRNPKTGPLTNSEDPDETPPNLTFHQVYTIYKGIKDLQTKVYNIFENYNLTSLNIYNEPS